jgi:hypothetical protein
MWLKWLVEETHKERMFRFPNRNEHKSYLLVRNMPKPVFLPELLSISPFAQAMPDKYKCNDPAVAYRQYYIHEKQHLFSWTNRERPCWITNEEIRGEL